LIEGQDCYRAVEEHFAAGGGALGLAKKVDMSRSTLGRVFERDPRAALARDWGLGRREDWLVQQLHDPAVKNKVPILFELKCRNGWIDAPKPEPEQSRVRVEVVLPKALSESEYRRHVFDVTPRKDLPVRRGDAN